MTRNDALAALGAARDAGEYARITAMVCEERALALEVYRALRRWGGRQVKTYGITHAVAGATAHEIERRLDISPDYAAPARRQLDRELYEFGDYMYAVALQYGAPCNRVWVLTEERTAMPVKHYTPDEVAAFAAERQQEGTL